jgi:hypothetical protein
MTIVISSVFHIICFPHEGRIVTIDQVASNLSEAATNPGSTVPWIENSQSTTESIGCGMYPSLMGSFDFSTPISYLRSTPVGYQNSSPLDFTSRVTSFRTSYLHDPWMLPSRVMWVNTALTLGWSYLCLQLRSLTKLFNRPL